MDNIAKQLRCAIYVRVATPLQAQEDHSTLLVQNAEAYALSKGYGFFSSNIYTEISSDSTYQERPRLQALLEAVRHGEFDVLIVPAYEAISDIPEKVGVIIATLSNYGIRIESVAEESPGDAVMAVMDQMVRELHTEIAKIERENIANRARAARKQRK